MKSVDRIGQAESLIDVEPGHDIHVRSESWFTSVDRDNPSDYCEQNILIAKQIAKVG